MRLGCLTLERYGPFEHLDLPIDPAPGRVNLVIAPNGFGKSVIRRAIGDFLYGIDERTPMSFRFGNERMRLLADVVHGGATRALVRRKGRGNTLADASGAEIPLEEIRQILGGADATTFRELFGLDTALLRSGGDQLIRGQGRLGQVLFAAGGGMGQVRALLDTLESKRDDLGRASFRHRARPIWAALTSWELAVKDLRNAALRPDGWVELESRAKQAAAALAALLQEQAELGAERDRLRTIAAVRPWLDRLRAAREVLAEGDATPDLDDTFEQRWRAALEAGAIATRVAAEAETALQATINARAALRFAPEWLRAGDAIDALSELRGRAAGAEADLPKRRAELREAGANAARLRKDLGWDDSVAIPPAPVVKDAQRRLQRYPNLASAAGQAETEREAAALALAHLQAQLDTVPEQEDVAKVVDFARLARAAGDPAARIDAGRRKLRQAEAALAKALAAIPDRPMTEAALDGTAAPSEPRLDAADEGLNAAAAAHAEKVRVQMTRAAEIDAERAALAALEQTAALPPQGALEAARRRRDRLWRDLAGAEPPDAARAIAFDRALREADDVADALIAHGEEAAKAAAMRARLGRLEAELELDRTAVTRAEAALRAARDALAGIAIAAGGEPLHDMRGLRAFLQARADAAARRAERDAAAAELRAIEAEVLAAGCHLAAAMAVPPPDLDALPTLLAEADRLIAAAAERAAGRKALSGQVRERQLALATRTAAADRAHQALEAWRAQWTPVGRLLARPDDEAPDATADVLLLVEQLRRAEADRETAALRIREMTDAIAALTANVAALAGLAPELAAAPPIAAADGFRLRLEQERLADSRCRDADARVADAERALAESRVEADAAARTLAGLRAALGCATNEDAEIMLRRARAVSLARHDSEEATRELSVQGGGQSLEQLSARAAATTAEADAARAMAIDARRSELETLIAAARETNAAASAALEQAGAGEAASDAARRREESQALLSRLTEEALVLHAAHALLRSALDRRASRLDRPLLARIGTVFRAITGGAQAGVAIDDGKDGQTMVALEADGVTRKPLDQLSEGTCDQLYLALRVAALEDYAKLTAPLPFIADDILQTFDDPRTEATLRALLQLSKQVQVIALTHHAHIGHLAAALPAGAVHVVRMGE